VIQSSATTIAAPQSTWRDAIVSPLGVVVMCAVICILLYRAAGHLLVALVGAIAVLVIGMAWPYVTSRSVRFKMNSTQDRITKGEPLRLKVETHNALPVGLPQFDLVGVQPESMALDTIGVGTRVQELLVPTTQRGVVEFDTCRISTSFPFGLIRCRSTLETTGRVIVWPKPHQIDDASMHALSRSSAAQRSVASTGSEGEPAGVRPYRRGDSIRHVHWQQTARHDRLMVRERTAVESKQCEIRLDTRTRSYRDGSHFDLAVERVAGLMDVGLLQKVAVRLQVGQSVLVVNNADARVSAMDVLAQVKLEDDDAVANSNSSGLFVTSASGSLDMPHAAMVAMVVEPGAEATT
jgi:uncharacterized protein (DUF58 family)